MNLSLSEVKKLIQNDSLDLRGCTSLTSLPDGLTVGGWVNLRGCTSLTSLPDGLTVGGCINLSHCTSLTSLPDGLTVGGWVNLRGCTSLTSLPDGLTVGDSLDLRGCTSLTSLPEGLTVGYCVYSDLPVEGQYTKLKNGDYVANRYIYADGILTHVRARRKLGKYILYSGKIPGCKVVYDGTYYAYCESLRDGIADLAFKHVKDRGTEEYKGYSLESVVSFKKAVSMYRHITGACRQGTEQFINSLPEVKNSYTIREMIELTEGQYGSERFKDFFQ